MNAASVRLPDAELVFEPLETGHWKVVGATHAYTIVADAAHGIVCTCPGFQYRETCRHVNELLRRQRAAGMSVEPVDQFPEAIVEDPAAQRATIGEVRDGEIPLGDPPADGSHLKLVEEIDRETEETLDRVDRRVEAIEARQPLLRSLAEIRADPAALEPPTAVVPRLAYRGRVTLVAGREKLSGKSTLLTAGAAAVTRGAGFLGEPTIAGPVLWVTADQEHASDILQRAERFAAELTRFHVLWPRERFADLAAALARVQPVLVVIDTLANFAGVDDPHSSAEWPRILLPLVQIARERDLAVTIAHHASKGVDGGYRDSTAIGATVDLILELLPDGADPARRNVKALGRWPVTGFALALVGDTYQTVAGGELSLEARVLACIQQHPCCSKVDVRTNTGGRSEDIDAALGRLLASGTVRDVGTARRHSYEAAAEGDRVPF